MHSVFRRRWLFAIALTAAVFLVTTVPRMAAQGGEPQSFAIRGATVVPVSGPRIENATVIVAHGVITAVGKDVTFPQETWVIDGKGLTVYPGLFDSLTDIGLVTSAPVAKAADARNRRFRAGPKTARARLPGMTPRAKQPSATSVSRHGEALVSPPLFPRAKAASFQGRERFSTSEANATVI